MTDDWLGLCLLSEAQSGRHDMTEKKLKKLQQELGREQAMSRLLTVMAGHVGRSKAIGMGELFTEVSGKDWENRINDTRWIRTLVSRARRAGTPICSRCCSFAPGYYIAAAGSEMRDYLERLKKQGLKKLAQVSRHEKTSLAELLGQMILNLKGEQN